MNEEPYVFEELPEIVPRFCAEPIPMGVLMAEVRRTWLTGRSEPSDAEHPFEGKCRECAKPLDVAWTQLERCTGWFPVNVHVECLPAYYAKTGVEGQQAEQWQKICPPEFRKPWDSMRGNGKLLGKVLGFDPKQGKGLLIHGPTGACKTRAAWRLAYDLMCAGNSVTFVASIDLPDENVKDMMHAPILIIDDLGNDRMQANKESLVLKILRHRIDWKRPTIITTQFTGDRLEERFSDGNTAKAVIRRLREYCDGVSA